MTATPSMGYLTELLESLKQRVTELENGERLGNSSIAEGALIARDGSGAERARFGQLTDGTFGVTGRFVGGDVIGANLSGSTVSGGTVTGAVVEGGTVRTPNLVVTGGAGNELSLSQLLAQRSGKVAAQLTIGPASGGTLAANTWHYDTALNQTVPVMNGRLDITITARLLVTVNKGDLTAGFRVTGPTGVAPSREDGLGCYWDGASGMEDRVQASYRTLVTGLASGTYTVCPAYFLGSVGSPGSYGEVSNRAIVVLPY